MIISYGWIDEIICVFCKNWISFLVNRAKIDLLPSKQNKTQQVKKESKVQMFLMIKRVSKRLLERSEQQNRFRGFQIMCKNKLFKEIGGRNHLNFVNNEILMFLMIKESQNTC